MGKKLEFSSVGKDAIKWEFSNTSVCLVNTDILLTHTHFLPLSPLFTLTLETKNVNSHFPAFFAAMVVI